MKKILINIWNIACFPLLYIVMSFLVTIAYTMFIGVVEGVKIGLSGEMADPQALQELILSKMDLNIPLVINALFCLLLIFIILRNKGTIKEVYRLNKISLSAIVLTVILGISANLFTSGAINLTSLTEIFPEYEQMMERILGGNFVIQVISIAILAPLLEEIIFRGIVLNRLTKMTNVYVAVLIQAAIFGFIHFNILQGMYAFILGVVLGLVFIWLDSLWATISIHIIYNLTSVLMGKIFGETEISFPALILITSISLIITAISTYVIYRKSRKDTEYV